MLSVFDLMQIIQTTESAVRFFQRIRWPHGVFCVRCGVFGRSERHSKTMLGFQKYRCRDCRAVFSDTNGTFLHKKQLDARTLFYALYELSFTKGITSVELGQKLGIPQRKAWTILMLLRTQCERLIETIAEELVFRGVVESDEAYLGKGINAQMVQGIVQRGRHAIVLPIRDRTEATLKGNIKIRVMRHAHVMTDTASAYGGLSCSGYVHYTLNHSNDEFSKGDGIHSNTIEGFWGNLKKVLYGVHHGVSKKHLTKYIAEYVLKYNVRKQKSTYSILLSQFLSPPQTC